MGSRIITKTINISGIEIEVNRKSIKNMYLKVSGNDGKVRISAPLRTKDDDIIKFVMNKVDWINKHLEKFDKQSEKTEMNYLNGEIHYIWGEPYILMNYYGSKSGVKIMNNTLILTTCKESSRKQREKLLMEWYREQLRNKLVKLVEKWENIISVSAKAVRIRSMKSRWGTCYPRDKYIWINLHLAKKPAICLEYVVVHELIHLLEQSHNAVFKGYMDHFLSNWREIKKELAN
jgi:predicted metal-dependent hydrolase